MSRFNKKWSAIAVSSICILTTLFAIPVLADDELDAETKASIEASVESFVETVYSFSDSDLESLRSNGDFYNDLVDTVEENEEVLGEFQSISSVNAESGDNDYVVCTVGAEFENYDAELIMYLSDSGTVPSNFKVNVDYSLGEKMISAAKNTVIAIIIVFVLLMFLAFIISLFKYINPQTRKEAKEKKVAALKAEFADASAGATNESVSAAPAVEAKPQQASEAQVDSDEIAAVIAAVIAAAIAAAEAEGTGDGYVVRSVRKVGTSRGWKRA